MAMLYGHIMNTIAMVYMTQARHDGLPCMLALQQIKWLETQRDVSCRQSGT
jgi:protein-tyrosine phosphatase